MAMKILDDMCTGCGSCEFVCPNKAILMKGDIYAINPDKCNECVGHFESPQCVPECPADAIVKAAA